MGEEVTLDHIIAIIASIEARLDIIEKYLK
jgi:hypothetical protein